MPRYLHMLSRIDSISEDNGSEQCKASEAMAEDA